jgi:hypothetical protein
MGIFAVVLINFAVSVFVNGGIVVRGKASVQRLGKGVPSPEKYGTLR